MTGNLISTSSDFKNLIVYEGQGSSGPLYTIAFDNLEYGGWRTGLLATANAVMFILLTPGLIYLADAKGVGFGSWLAGAALMLGVFGGMAWRVDRPWNTHRAIELDMGADALRVLKNGKPKIERQLSRMENLTVEEHPDAELARVNRQQDGKKTLKDVEKQHCLIGWFGAGGSEQVILISRAEFPSRNSLFEVRQAILWTIEHARSLYGHPTSGESGLETREAPGRVGGSIKPPLD